ncbi:hypothetical protein HYV49_05595 [Candidatus Pacearchaeota archaeon]|nr:hypothetical protein [Candidatus Pacearchaeota archaeon]
MYWEYLLAFAVLLTAVPVAYVLAKLTKEEIRKRKRFFIALIVLFGITSLLSLILRFNNWKAVLFTSLFMILVELGLLMFSKR